MDAAEDERADDGVKAGGGEGQVVGVGRGHDQFGGATGDVGLARRGGQALRSQFDGRHPQAGVVEGQVRPCARADLQHRAARLGQDDTPQPCQAEALQ